VVASEARQTVPLMRVSGGILRLHLELALRIIYYILFYLLCTNQKF
jgi:hypothetical protein